MGRRTKFRGWKGCCAMCAAGKGKIKSMGQRERQPHRDHRKIGKTRRVTRKDLGDQM